MSSTTTIPPNLVYSAILHGLMDCPELRVLARVGSVIRWDGLDDNPEHDSVNDGDLPELRLEQVGFTNNPRSTSSSFSMSIQYSLTMRTAHLRQAAADGINAITWYAAIALERMRQRNRPSGLEFVKSLQYGPTRIGKQTNDEDGAPTNWAAVLTVTADCSFSLSEWIDGRTA